MLKRPQMTHRKPKPPKRAKPRKGEAVWWTIKNVNANFAICAYARLYKHQAINDFKKAMRIDKMDDAPNYKPVKIIVRLA